MESLARALNEGFIYQGERSGYLGASRGSKVTDEPANAFVLFIQNHDQVGNRPFGERLHHQIDIDRYAVASALLLLAPETPLLFMGQEFAASTPFLFFSDHHQELGRLVTEGRRKEFGGFRVFADESSQAMIPDPQAEATFLASKLKLEERERHSRVYTLYQRLLALRNDDPVFAIQDRRRSRATPIGANAIALHRWLEDEHRILIANFGAELEMMLEKVDGLPAQDARRLKFVFSTRDLDVDSIDRGLDIEGTPASSSATVPARTAMLFSIKAELEVEANPGIIDA